MSGAMPDGGEHTCLGKSVEWIEAALLGDFNAEAAQATAEASGFVGGGFGSESLGRFLGASPRGPVARAQTVHWTV